MLTRPIPTPLYQFCDIFVQLSLLLTPLISKVVPKKSATAKTISKGSTNAPAKSKKYIDTESESEVDDSMSFSMTKLTQKEQKSKKEKEKKSTKSPKEKPKSSGQKPAAPGSKASSSAKAASMFSGSGSEDTDTSLIRCVNYLESLEDLKV